MALQFNGTRNNIQQMKLSKSSAFLGAAFLMATSAIGPGFITQTTVFTQQLTTSFGFVILMSIILDIAAQMNIWRIITIAEKPAPFIANDVFKGSGYVLTVLVMFGGLAFNIGNIAGAGLGINVLTSIDSDLAHPTFGVLISMVIALIVFWVKEIGKAIDWFSKIMGLLMILLTAWIAKKSNPPVFEAIKHSVFPDAIDARAIITLVGGTVGGYISFAGAHRLLDAGIKGTDSIKQVTNASIKGIVLAGVMRILLFLAALGVVSHGVVLSAANPAASVFQSAAGSLGQFFFGLVLWAAAITSVVGAAYTSVSFLKVIHPFSLKQERVLISTFIVFSTGIFLLIGQPVRVLVAVGALNGVILPFALALMLLAANKKNYLQQYQHPRWLSVIGWLVVAVMTWLSILLFISEIPKLWR